MQNFTAQVPATKSMMAVISSVFAVGAVVVMALAIAAIVGICMGIALFLNIALAVLSQLCSHLVVSYGSGGTPAQFVLWAAAMSLVCLFSIVVRHRNRVEPQFAGVDYE